MKPACVALMGAMVLLPWLTPAMASAQATFPQVTPAEAVDMGLKVGVLWYQSSSKAQVTCDAFVQRLREQAPQIQIEVAPALATVEDVVRTYEQFYAGKDTVVFLRSEGSVYLRGNPPVVPAFIGSATSPVALGLMREMDRPDGNVTGVTYYLPARRQLEAYRQILPHLRSVGLLLKRGHPSSKIDQDDTAAACRELGLRYQVAICSTREDVDRAVAKLRDEVDALIIGNQNLIFDHSQMIARIAGTTPVFSYTGGPVLKGHALAGFVADDEKLGRMLADSVIQVLVEGRPVSQVPVKTDPEPQLLLNMAKVKELKLSVPDEVLKSAKLIQ